ncbi:MAG: SUMF1/EgtB/PvdO family nonheme iron enzyme [Candidatus Marinimicrobia bacterium]|nr:SUMF1/EgtB/PvdO family nonheme iron enzyme [Candidatus Neomarinimicrobiota bacterium]
MFLNIWCLANEDRQKTNRVLRGGSWNNNDNNCRVANRNRNNPNNRNNNNGFRLVSQVSFLFELFEGIQLIMRKEESRPILVISVEIRIFVNDKQGK